MPAINRIDATARVNGKGRKAPADRSGKLPRLYLCMMYADDRNAGKIINFIVSWYPHAKRRRNGTQGLWSVFSRQDICKGAELTPKQYRNAMPVAIGCGAVDFVIGGHAGKKAIFTRPTGALMAYLQNATDRLTAHRLRPKGRDGGRDGGRDPIQPLHSLQVSQKKDKSPVPGGKGRAADRLPPGETSPCPAGPDDLLSRVKAAKAGGLGEAELRAELLQLLPPAPRKHEHGVWHPSEKYPAWPMWSPGKLIEKQALYEQYVDNWYRAHPDAARRAAEPLMTDEEAIANGMHVYSDEEKMRMQESVNRPFDEEED